MGHLHAFWHAVLEQQEDGDLTSWTDEMIADAAQFKGEPAHLVTLLQKHRWLDGRLVHDWLDYAGLYLIRKYSRRNKKRLAEIWAKHGKVYGSEQTESVASDSRSDCRSAGERQSLAPNQPITKPNQPTMGEGVVRPPPADPGYHPDKVPKAQQVVDHYQKATGFDCAAGGAAIRAVIGCLLDGFDCDQLMKAADSYVAWSAEKQRKRQGAIRFYGDGTFKDYLNGVPKVETEDEIAKASEKLKALRERLGSERKST